MLKILISFMGYINPSLRGALRREIALRRRMLRI
jgi:hypothetical protein